MHRFDETALAVGIFTVAVMMLIASVYQAHSQEVCTSRCILPPAEYDKPYTGKLTIEEVPGQDVLAQRCGAAYIPGVTLACSRRYAESCHIVMVPDAIIVMKGWTRALMLRHELGHCNGWGGDHRGQRNEFAR